MYSLQDGRKQLVKYNKKPKHTKDMLRLLYAKDIFDNYINKHIGRDQDRGLCVTYKDILEFLGEGYFTCNTNCTHFREFMNSIKKNDINGKFGFFVWEKWGAGGGFLV